MQFTPIEGKDVLAFDEETRKLYQKRVSDPRLTQKLISMNRVVDRNYLPNMASVPTQFEKDKENY